MQEIIDNKISSYSEIRTFLSLMFQNILLILEDFYNLFIYKRFERKDKIEVTNWQPCLFLRFAVNCYQCHSSWCKSNNKNQKYTKATCDFSYV